MLIRIAGSASNCPILSPYAPEGDSAGLPAVNVEPARDSSTATNHPGSVSSTSPSLGVCPVRQPSPNHTSTLSASPSAISAPEGGDRAAINTGVEASHEPGMMDPHAFSNASNLSAAAMCVPPTRVAGVHPPPSGLHHTPYSYATSPYSTLYRDPQADGYYGRVSSPHLQPPHTVDQQPFSPHAYGPSLAAPKAEPASRSVTPDMEDLVERGQSDEMEEPNSNCTAFISKLYHLCSHEEYRDYIRWNTAGDAFVLAHANTHFATTILPRFFRHSNVSSFIRQLNLYNFTRLPTIQLLDTVDASASASPTSAFSGFSHPCFHRGDEISLRLIKPKPSKSKASRKAAAAAAAASAAAGGRNGGQAVRKVSSASRRSVI